MPSTGTPSSATLGSHTGAPASYTELGPPERTTPAGSSLRISSSGVVHGRIAENTSCSRMRRAISRVYWPPKSSTTIPPCVLAVASVCCGAKVLVLAFASLIRFLDSTDSSLIRSAARPPSIVTRHLRSLLQYDVYQLLRHHDHLSYPFSIQKYLYARIGHCPVPRFVFAQAVFHHHLAAQPPVHLDDDLNLLFACQVFAIARPLLLYQPARNSQHLPEFFGDVGRHGRYHQDQRHQHALENHRRHIGLERLLILQLVHQFHDQRHGRIEMP